MIKARGLTKRYGDTVAVSDLSFTVEPGRVTGFLGPNGSGKSTTMRMILGLDRPTSGSVTVNGRAYADHPAPLAEVGALLEAKAVHTSRSAYHHLRAMAATHAIPAWRVEEVIELVGLTDVARRRVGGFSLGMGQRLGIAAALLADPDTIILDEPVNGLDPDGIRWVRQLLRRLAGEGRTVLLSSHLMSEMELTADHIMIIGRGRMIADLSIEDLRRAAGGDRVFVRSPQLDRLRAVLTERGATVSDATADTAEVSGVNCEAVGILCAALQVPIYELTPRRVSLEETFIAMTQDALDYQAVAA